jgi:hypothetical protein
MVLLAVVPPLWDAGALVVGARLLYLHHRKDAFWTWILSLVGLSVVLSVALRFLDWVIGWHWNYWPLSLLPIVAVVSRRVYLRVSKRG